MKIFEIYPSVFPRTPKGKKDKLVKTWHIRRGYIPIIYLAYIQWGNWDRENDELGYVLRASS